VNPETFAAKHLVLLSALILWSSDTASHYFNENSHRLSKWVQCGASWLFLRHANALRTGILPTGPERYDPHYFQACQITFDLLTNLLEDVKLSAHFGLERNILIFWKYRRLDKLWDSAAELSCASKRCAEVTQPTFPLDLTSCRFSPPRLYNA
jgi:hypothetical protein